MGSRTYRPRSLWPPAPKCTEPLAVRGAEVPEIAGFRDSSWVLNSVVALVNPELWAWRSESGGPERGWAGVPNTPELGRLHWAQGAKPGGLRAEA